MKNTLKGLQGLRGISILIVLLSHLKLKSLPNLNVPSLFLIFFDGIFGVHVFFVLSGFLISYLLLLEKKKTRSISIKSFYLRRFLRIFPAYFFLLLIYAILQKLGIITLSSDSWLSSLIFLKWLFGGDWISGHFWSLSIEENFYLFWPFIFKFSSINRLKIVLLIIVLASCICRVIGYYSFFSGPIFINYFSIVYHIDSITIGALGAIYFEKIKFIFVKYKLDKYFLFYLFLIVIFSSRILTDLNYNNHLHLGFLFIPLGVGGPSSIIVSFCILLIIYSLILTESIMLNYLFNSSLLVFIGTLSFSIYLWQQIFFAPEIQPLNKFPFNLLFIFIISITTYYFIEKPFLKFKAKFIS